MFGTANRRPNWHRRPDTVQIQSSSHREDQQPNETIVKRHTIAPPILLPGSIPKPRSHYGQGMDISWTTGANGHGSRGGWTQVGKRGKKRGQGGYGSSRGGGRGRGDSVQHRSSFDSPGASTSTSVPPGEHTQPIFTTKPFITTRSASPPGTLPSQASTFRTTNRNHEAPLVAQSMKFKPPLPTRQRFQGKSASAPFPPQPLPHNPSPSQPLITNSSSLPVTLARTPTPPFKRRKVDHTPDSHPPIKAEEIEDQGIPQIALSPPPLIKHEDRTPSPPPPQRRLVTESCSFYPLPVNCQKSNPDYKQNRHALFSREYNILKSLGLQKTKVLFREDGMVIEWTSPTPVWSDTLRPEPSNLSLMIEAALRANSMSSSSKRKSTTPRRSASRSTDYHLNNDANTSSSSVKTSSPQGEPPSQKPASLSSVPPLPHRRPLPKPKPKPRSLVKSNISMDTPIATTNSRPEAAQPAESSAQGQVSQPTMRVTSATAWSAGELAEVEPMAISYLQRYIRTFDTDRSLLQGGYAANAIFSVRVPRSEGAIQANGTSPESDVRFAQGPGLIGEAINSLGPHKFCPRGVGGKVLYDVVSLNSGAGGGILLTVHGEVVDEGLDADSYQAEANTFLITQSFVLQRNRDMDRMELWPLQATSHQMVLRHIGSTGPRLLSAVEATSLEDEFPWLP